MNSAGAEPDSVDIYSMEVFEVIKTGKDHIEEEKPAPEIHRTKPLDGTQKASTHSVSKALSFVTRSLLIQISIQSLANLHTNYSCKFLTL